MRFRGLQTLVAVLGLGLTSTPAAAQARVELIPYFASYFPTQSLAVIEDSGTKVWQTAAAMFGAAVRLRITPTLGAEGSFAYSPSPLRTESPSGLTSGSLTSDGSGYLLFPSVRVVFSPRRSNLFALGGIAAVMRRGKTWESPSFDTPTSAAAVVGFGVRSEVRTNLSLYVNVEGYLYGIDPDGTLPPTDEDGNPLESLFTRTFQADIVVRIGVPIGFFRR